MKNSLLLMVVLLSPFVWGKDRAWENGVVYDDPPAIVKNYAGIGGLTASRGWWYSGKRSCCTCGENAM
jgi:hypothetical protein